MHAQLDGPITGDADQLVDEKYASPKGYSLGSHHVYLDPAQVNGFCLYNIGLPSHVQSALG